MVDVKQPVDVLAVRRNGLWTIKIFVPENKEPMETIVARDWNHGCGLVEKWLEKGESVGDE
jgi:hypothetical protein|tara:strand:- start:840 stop:1022 length:183 start_codon:yes stop_codon:yes gene_type:complete